jgi:hypothetical protein
MKNRSGWLQRPLFEWLEWRRRTSADRAYIASYTEDPEEDIDAATLAKLAADTWADLDE